MTFSPKRRASASSPSDLDYVRKFVLPEALVAETLEVLAEAGSHGYEAFVVWGGVVEGDALKYRSLIVPEQRGHKTPTGLLVTVDGAALFEVNKTFYQRGELLAGQIHSHPTEAYHSDTDDCFSLVTMTGSLSVVVPYFAVGGIDAIDEWAWYRLTGPRQWSDLTVDDCIQLDRRNP